MKCFALIGLLWLAACGSAERWIAEDESGAVTLTRRGDTLEIVAPAGLTLWYAEPLGGDYRISYDATVLMEQRPHDRLADLNCFWAASDPLHPDDFFARSSWRGGVFARYNSLDLFYVGYGGNDNTTTRFRRYYGLRYGAPNDEVKPLAGEYTDPEFLLRPNRPLHIEITVEGSRTAFAVDGRMLFSRRIEPGEGDGYFGLRLLSNRTLVSGFKIERL
ncbi:DUF6250 domain-containing protein [Alistipes sp.]|uniref:DUF6250 domain-containing protein n=1 Tax=Alistipes sp. TaxID=1872444 RepID=UPI003AF12828